MEHIRIIAFHPNQLEMVKERFKTCHEKDQLEIYFMLEYPLTMNEAEYMASFPIKKISLDETDFSIDIENKLNISSAQERDDIYSIYIYLDEKITASTSNIMHQLFASEHEHIEIVFDKKRFFRPERNRQRSSTRNLEDELQQINTFISSGNYQSAKRIVESWSDVATEIKHLLQFGYSMYNQELHVKMYNTVDMIKLLTQQMQQLHYSKESIHYINNLKALEDYDQVEFIYFLHNYLENLYVNNDLIDFVVLYYRLAEEALLYAIGLDYYISEGTNRPKFKKRKNANYSIPIGNKRFSNHYYDYLDLLEERIQDPSVNKAEVEAFEKYFHLFNQKRFKRFLELRHEGVSGHGFADFTKEKFETICDGSPLDMLDNILDELELRPPYSIFVTLNDVLQELIQNTTEYSRPY